MLLYYTPYLVNLNINYKVIISHKEQFTYLNVLCLVIMITQRVVWKIFKFSNSINKEIAMANFSLFWVLVLLIEKRKRVILNFCSGIELYTSII